MEFYSRLQTYLRKHPMVADILLVAILTLPAMVSLFHPGYFSMHDDQHIGRLFVFDQALRQGDLFPRWVDGLGFGFGYPLFNFYPPLIYYIAELFHVVGISLIWSIKLVLMLGFVSAAIGMYLFVKTIFKRQAGIVAAVFYTYFFYHAVTIYVRGAFAEYFTLSILPFLFLALFQLYKKPTVAHAVWSGIVFALLILCHPLIALPSLIFIGLYCLFLYIQTPAEKRNRYVVLCVGGFMVALGLTAFFWLPSIIERKFTYIDAVFIGELGKYTLHFVNPIQFWQSLWGYGGSGAGLQDGFTFQLGKVHMFFAAVATVIIGFLFYSKHEPNIREKTGMVMIGMLFLSLFLCTDLSKFLWDTIPLISYMQFPWRFLTFTAFFISVVGSIVFYYVFFLMDKLENSLIRSIGIILFVATIGATISLYSRYDHPQYFRDVTDAQLTTKDEISWKVSLSSFEFAPKGIKTTRSSYGTTMLAITPADIPKDTYTIVKGKALVEKDVEKASYKSFILRVGQPVTFQLNTFNFPGWEATLLSPQTNKEQELAISDANPFKLITVSVPPGEYVLSFQFTDTPIRFAGSIISLITVLGVALYQWKRKDAEGMLARQFEEAQSLQTVTSSV